MCFAPRRMHDHVCFRPIKRDVGNLLDPIPIGPKRADCSAIFRRRISALRISLSFLRRASITSRRSFARPFLTGRQLSNRTSTVESDSILSRVNDYFGFTAVNRLKLVQKPIGTPAGEPSRPPADAAAPPSSRVADIVGDIEDENLRSELDKLGRGVFRRGSSRQN